MTSVRRAAADVLLGLDRGHTTLAAEVDRHRGALVDRRDRALLVELTAGTLRWRNAIDRVIQIASGRRIADIETRALAVLRLGVYQLRYLTRIPAHAVLNESVECVRELGAPRAAPFVNAVLRSVVRGGARLVLPERPAEADSRNRWVEYLSTTLSHPAWLVERWLDRYGAEHTAAWCELNNRTPPVVVRPLGGSSAAPLLASLRAAGIDATPARYVPDALTLPAGALGRLPPEELERVHVQDEGSQLVARVAGARPGERVLDLCAAPGGKSLVMAGDMGLPSGARPGDLVACDYRAARVRLLAATMRKARLPVPIVRLDARRPLPFGPTFDAVLLDAPCSGLGTLSRDPDLKWHRAADDLAPLATEQLRLIRSAADAVRPGGRLVYATCSSEPEENIAVVEAFLAIDRRFVFQPVSSEAGLSPSMIDARGCLSTLPFRDGIDAFFAARLARRDGT